MSKKYDFTEFISRIESDDIDCVISDLRKINIKYLEMIIKGDYVETADMVEEAFTLRWLAGGLETIKELPAIEESEISPWLEFFEDENKEHEIVFYKETENHEDNTPICKENPLAIEYSKNGKTVKRVTLNRENVQELHEYLGKILEAAEVKCPF